jgi:hypothetical protein
MKRSKDYTLLALFIPLCIACLFEFGIGCEAKKDVAIVNPFKYAGYETDDTTYFNGQILYPDYVHLDTLIVTDATRLNQLIGGDDIGSDQDIIDVLCITTEIK